MIFRVGAVSELGPYDELGLHFKQPGDKTFHRLRAGPHGNAYLGQVLAHTVPACPLSLSWPLGACALAVLLTRRLPQVLFGLPEREQPLPSPPASPVRGEGGRGQPIDLSSQHSSPVRNLPRSPATLPTVRVAIPSKRLLEEDDAAQAPAPKKAMAGKGAKAGAGKAKGAKDQQADAPPVRLRVIVFVVSSGCSG